MRNDGPHYRIGRVLASLTVALAIVVGLAAATLGLAPSALGGNGAARRSGLATVPVNRGKFVSTIVASGRIESSQNTEIRCEVERVSNVQPCTILTMVDDGTTVKKGDVLATLDSSGYQELVRRQTITVDQARATHQQAELALNVAEINLESFKLGQILQNEQLLRSQIALAESDLTRQKDRLVWTERMREKGYLPVAQVLTEEQTLRRAELTLKQANTSLANFLRFTSPKQTRSYESAINGAKAALEFETIRLKREQERLDKYKLMVERCTVRAPHDGFVVLANRSGREQEIYVGATVRERMRLFTLPDLSKMEVDVLIHETVVKSVLPGWPVRIRVEALPGRSFEGVVKSVSPLPYAERSRNSGSTDVTYFTGRVTLTSKTDGLRPGMTAELEILAGVNEDVLTIPPDAVVQAEGRDLCRVLLDGQEEPETRELTLGRITSDRVEVVKGLSSGDQVVVNRGKADDGGASFWPWN